MATARRPIRAKSPQKNEVRPMDFLDAFDGYDKTYRHYWRNPQNGEKMLDKDGATAYVDLYSPKSLVMEEWKKQRYAEARREAKKNNKPEPTYEEAMAKNMTYYAAATAGWYLVNPKTKEGDGHFDYDMAVSIYSDRRAEWMVRQVEEVMSEDANFLTATASESK